MNKSGKAKLKKMAYRYWTKPTKAGYNKKGYDFNKSIKTFKKTGNFKIRKDGSGHIAGYTWAANKGVDPSDQTKRYSKNSPSFDEGVYQYKMEQKSKMHGMASKSPPKKQSS